MAIPPAVRIHRCERERSGRASHNKHTPWALLVAVVICGASRSLLDAQIVGFPGAAPTTPTFGLEPLPPGGGPPGHTGYDVPIGTLYPGVFGGAASPNPLPQVGFYENETSFYFVVVGGLGRGGGIDPIVADQTLTFFVIGNFWSIQTTMTFDPASAVIFANDVFRMTGDVVHRIAPHPGEFAPGDAIPYDLEINGGRAITLAPHLGFIPNDQAFDLLRQNGVPAGTRFGLDFREATHPPGLDRDILVGMMAGRITAPNIPFVAGEFDLYVSGITGRHVPEPAAVAALMALAGLAWAWARRRHMQHA